MIKLHRQFIHGQTYQGHLMVCAAAAEIQRVIKQQDLVANANSIGALLESKLKEAFASNPYVGDIRGRGLFWVVSLLTLQIFSCPKPLPLLTDCYRSSNS